jgi:glutamyl-tRNA synthetase
MSVALRREDILRDYRMTDSLTRLAPSPTGALHLGNARTFVINWALAKQNGWRIAMRIEDLDTPRTKANADQQALDVLAWLGLTWDDGPTYQADDLSPYHTALDRLARRGLIYPCTCTRKDIVNAASAPHAEDEHELRYPGTHRPDTPTPARYEPINDTSWRLCVPDEPIAFDDAFMGPQSINVQRLVGDFVVASKAGLPAYQLAVVVDDARQGVTHIVRGDDLLRSTPRQMLLYEMLDLGPAPAYYHLPLVKGEDGRRLAKRHGDTRLVRYRDVGVDPRRVIGLIAKWSGCGDGEPMTIEVFADRFDLSRLPREEVTFTADDERELLAT